MIERVAGNDRGRVISSSTRQTANCLQPAALNADHLQRLHAFADRCVKGLVANREHCEELIEKSLMMCTALAPKIGRETRVGSDTRPARPCGNWRRRRKMTQPG
jgi:hypothetical protein